MSSEKNKVEALLFSVGRKMSEEELCKLTKLKPDVLKVALEELRRDYESKEGSLSLFKEEDGWKLMTKEEYLPLVQGIVSETELDKALMETLAVIAWKYPILQADVIKIRNNKAYDHLRELEQAGFIARERKGRTKTIKLSPKFFEYFQLPPSKSKTKDAFREIVPPEIREKVEQAEKDIEETEQKIEEINKKKEEMEEKRRKEKVDAAKKKEIDIVDDFGKETKLEEYEVQEEEEKPKEEKVGKLETYNDGDGYVQSAPRINDNEAEKRAQQIETEEVSPEVEKEMERMLHGEEGKEMSNDDLVPNKKIDSEENKKSENEPVIKESNKEEE